MKIFLDDERVTTNDWVLIKNVYDLKKLFVDRYNEISIISLDHDLGLNQETGYDFLWWLESEVHFGVFDKVPELVVHSANPVGVAKMKQAIESIKNICVKNNIKYGQ